MANQFTGGVKAGSTSVSISVILRKTADSTELTGTVASGVTARYWRQGGSPTALTTPSDLSLITSAWAAGGWKAADATNLPGVYRLDVDNAAFASGADWVVISVKVSTAFLFVEKFQIVDNVAIVDGTSPLTESYSSGALTLAQALYEIAQVVGQFSISGTTLSFQKRDKTTLGGTFTLNSSTFPTSRTRAS